MQDATASEAVGSALRAVPIAVGGSTVLGYSWSDFVNILASISIGLQIVWFLYDKACILKGDSNGKDSSK